MIPKREIVPVPTFKKLANFIKLKIMKYYFLAYKKMFDFNGKSSKKEFWNFFIIDMLIFILIGFFEGFTSYTLLADNLLFIYIAISIIPLVFKIDS
mgnify:FL=1